MGSITGHTGRRLVALSAALAVLAGCGSDASESDAAAVDTTTTTAAGADGETTLTESSTEVESDPHAPAGFVGDADVLDLRSGPVEVGSHRVDSLGTPLSLTVGEEHWVQVNGGGMFVLTHPRSNGPDDRDIVFLRLPMLTDPDVLVDSLDILTAGDDLAAWPSTDFAGWLDAVPDEIVVTDRAETTLGGLDATFAQLEIVDPDCGRSAPCAMFGINHDSFRSKALTVGSVYRIWMIDQPAEDPLAVIVGASREPYEEWFEAADTVLATVAFGEVGANPVSLAEGTAELEALGGIRVSFDQPMVVDRAAADFATVKVANAPHGMEMLTNPVAVDGTDLPTVNDLIGALDAAGVSTTEVESVTVGGEDARVFDIGSPSGSPALRRSAVSSAEWFAPPRARLWVIEHPDRGLLMITAEAYVQPDEFFEPALEAAAPVLASLEFVE